MVSVSDFEPAPSKLLQLLLTTFPVVNFKNRPALPWFVKRLETVTWKVNMSTQKIDMTTSMRKQRRLKQTE